MGVKILAIYGNKKSRDMTIRIERCHRNKDSLDGEIKINGAKVCDTAEWPLTSVANGTYQIELVKCKQHQRKVLRIKPIDSDTKPRCDGCPKKEVVGNNTRMPCMCPMITIGNGVYNRSDGSIIVGERVVWGTMIHSRKAYNKLYERIKKAIQRGNEVIVEITE